MDSEDAIWRDYLNTPLTWSGAFHRLVALGYAHEDAEDLVDEWSDAAEHDGHQ